MRRRILDEFLQKADRLWAISIKYFWQYLSITYFGRVSVNYWKNYSKNLFLANLHPQIDRFASNILDDPHSGIIFLTGVARHSIGTIRLLFSMNRNICVAFRDSNLESHV